MGNEQQRQEQQENTHQQRLLQHTEPLHTLPGFHGGAWGYVYSSV